MCMCSAFRIQLYWEKGYEWQEVDFEFEQFCMMHSYDGYPGYGKCFYGTKSGACLQDAVYIAPCNSDERQKWTFVNLRNGEFLIKAISTNKCMQRIGRSTIRMRECNSNVRRQRWYTPGTQNDNFKFPLSQANAPSICIGQLHHPKSGEVMEMENCKLSEYWDTLFWERQ